MANGQNVQDQTAAKIAAIRGSLGTNQPAPMPPMSQPSVATDPTVTGILSGIGPVMPSWPGANQNASVADPYQIASEDIGRQRAQAEKLVPLLARQEAMSRPQSPDNPEGIPKQGPGIDKGRGFGHNLGEVLHMVNSLADLAAYGVAFISLRDNLDLSTPSGAAHVSDHWRNGGI